MIEISVDTSMFDSVADMITGQQAARIYVLAIVDTLENGKTVAVREISKRTGLDRAFVKERIKRSTVRYGDLRGQLFASRRGISLTRFPSTTQNATGVYTRAWGRPQTLQSAFIAGVKGGTGPMERRTGATFNQAFRRVGAERLPIRKLYGPNIFGTFLTDKNGKVRALILKRMKDQLPQNITRRLRSILARKYKYGMRV